MKRLVLAVIFATSLVAAVEAQEKMVSQADLQAIIQRLNKLEAENQAQAKRIVELEASAKATEQKLQQAEMKVSESTKKFELQTATLSKIASAGALAPEGETTTNETGRIYTTGQGYKYYLADASARIFEPLSESGLKITPYGYLVLEGVYNTQGANSDWSTDYVLNPHSRGYKNHTTTLSMQDSIMGLQFETPEAYRGWAFTGRAEFDLAGDDQNSYDFHWRHLYINAQHESGWSILFGQTWHLWKIVTPSEIDSAWLENAGHPYRRSPQIRVSKTWDLDEKSSLEMRAGIVKGGPGMGGDRDDDGVQDNSASAWCLFEGALVYDHVAPWQEDERRWLVGVGGMYGQDRSRNFATDDKDDYNSMMLLLAGQMPFGKFTLTGQFYGGENLGGVQAGVGQRVIFNDQGYGKEVEAIGGFIDLGYQISDDWSLAVGYGFDHPTIGSDYVQGENGLSESIEHNDRAYIAAFYQVTTNFKLGVEYARLNTRYAENDRFKGGNAYDDRFQFSAFYDF